MKENQYKEGRLCTEDLYEAGDQQFLMITDLSVVQLQESPEVKIFIGNIIKTTGRE